MLPSPLHLLSYVTLRAQFDERILVTGELTTLGYHLQGNLWIDDEFSLALLDEGLAADLDIAMMVRRDGLAGESTPKGILTKIKDTRLGKIVSEIEHDPSQASVGIGLALLEMGEESVVKTSLAIDNMIRDARRTGRHHELMIPMEHRDAGLTIHINGLPLNEAKGSATFAYAPQEILTPCRKMVWVTHCADDGPNSAPKKTKCPSRIRL